VDVAGAIEHQVRRLDVTVDDTGAMGGVEGVAGLLEPREHGRRGLCAFPAEDVVQ
jgi:hypothetical protein